MGCTPVHPAGKIPAQARMQYVTVRGWSNCIISQVQELYYTEKVGSQSAKNKGVFCSQGDGRPLPNTRPSPPDAPTYNRLYIRYRSYLRLLVPGCGPYYFPIDLSRHITRRKVCGQCRSFGNGHCLSGRLSNCVSSCGLFGGGSADAYESYEPLTALKRRLWRLLKAGSPLSLPPHCTKALARSEC